MADVAQLHRVWLHTVNNNPCVFISTSSIWLVVHFRIYFLVIRIYSLPSTMALVYLSDVLAALLSTSYVVCSLVYLRLMQMTVKCLFVSREH